MPVPTGRATDRPPYPAHGTYPRQGRIVLSILLIAFLLDKFLVSEIMPTASGLIGVNPMIVFLDIPVDLSLTFGLLTFPSLFILLYSVARPMHSPRPRSWPVITGVLAIPFFTLSGGLLYLSTQAHLPKHARNAIESFGINADIHTAFPGYELIHLRGSMVMLLCFFIGMHICIRRISRRAPAAASLSLAPIPPSPKNTPIDYQGVQPAGLIAKEQPGLISETRREQLPERLTHQERTHQRLTVHDLYHSPSSKA